MRGGRGYGRPAFPFMDFLLPRHGNAHHFRGIYKVIGILCCIGYGNFNPFHCAVEFVALRAIVL